MNGIMQDFHYAVRQLRKNPGFTVVAVITLALGIGANTAIFTVANSVLLRDLPYQDPKSLVLLWSIGRDGGIRDQSSFTDIDDYRLQNHVFENIVPFGSWSATFVGGGDPARVPGMLIGDGYFSLMRAKPLLGRVFLPEEQIDGKDYELILSYGFWQQRFAGDRSVVGKKIDVSGRPYTVVGVMPQDFRMLPATLVDGSAQFYRPVAEKHNDKERLSRHLRAVARLKAGISLEQAQADLSRINRALAKQYPDEYSTTAIRVVRLHDDISSSLRPTLFVLLSAIGFLLLIACANVSNLLLSRAIRRKPEFALRSALGATRAQLVRQALTESLLLALCGGVCGVAIGYSSTQIIVALGAKIIPQLAGVSMDLPVLAFTVAASLLTGVLFGIIPALRMSQVSLATTPGDSVRSPTTSHDRLRQGLAVSEIALALVLLTGGGLLVRTLSKLRAVDPGFRSDHLLTMNLALPGSKYPENTAKPRAFYRELLQAINSLPGVQTAGAVSILPLGGNFDTAGTLPEGLSLGAGAIPYPERYIVTAGYFDAMKLRLKRGRFLTDADDENAPLVVLISETAAQRWWPNQDPIGRRVKVPGLDSSPPPWRTVVGVVEDVKQAGLSAPRTMQIYLAHAQFSTQFLTLVVRTESDPFSVVGEIRREVARLNPELPVSNVATMDQVMSESVAPQWFSAALLGSLSGLGLLLAMVGVYGVLSYGVSQKTREIGIRMALGAARREVLVLVVGNGLKLLLIGVVAGTVAALLVTRLMSNLLFGIRATDPLTFAGAAVFLSAIVLVASYIPARRATRLDPMVALRYE